MSDNDKMREDYDRLAKLAEKQDARIKELEGMVAMQAEQIEISKDALLRLTCGTCTCMTKTPAVEYHATTCIYGIAQSAMEQLSDYSTAETVAKYKAELTDPLRKEVQHLHLVVIKRLDDEATRLRREVAMLHMLVVSILSLPLQFTFRSKCEEAIANTQAAAQAYEAEVKAKALDDGAEICDSMYNEESMNSQNQTDDYRTGYVEASGDCGHKLRDKAESLRATSKKGGV